MFHFQDIANEGDINELGGGDGRHPPAHAERGDNALAGDLAGGNAVGKELSSRDEGDRAREVQHLNQVDHEDTNAARENSLGFLVSEKRGVFWSARRPKSPVNQGTAWPARSAMPKMPMTCEPSQLSLFVTSLGGGCT